jgi:hypothetical protein
VLLQLLDCLLLHLSLTAAASPPSAT